MSEQLWFPEVELRSVPEGFAGVVVPYGETSYKTEYGMRGERFIAGAFVEAELQSLPDLTSPMA